MKIAESPAMVSGTRAMTDENQQWFSGRPEDLPKAQQWFPEHEP
jgi:hypothetical protein